MLFLAWTLQDEDDFQWLVLGIMGTVLVSVVIILFFVLHDRAEEKRTVERMEERLHKANNSHPEIGTGPLSLVREQGKPHT